MISRYVTCCQYAAAASLTLMLPLFIMQSWLELLTPLHGVRHGLDTVGYNATFATPQRFLPRSRRMYPASPHLVPHELPGLGFALP